MNTQLLTDNLSNPALLFFLLGIFSVNIKSDLEIPANTSRFIALYLLFSIGFTGGQELAHETFTAEVWKSIALGLLLSFLIPVYAYFILRRSFSVYDSAAIAATYGSVSAVTFVTAVSYLEMLRQQSSGHMVAVMALMESPAIVGALFLMSRYRPAEDRKGNTKGALHHALTNGSVVMIMGSLLIGWLANAKQAEGIKPFTTDIFKGFLAIFLLDMGITSGRRLNTFLKNGWSPVFYAILLPLINGCVTAWISHWVTPQVGDRFMLAILAASASYIAVPAAMKIAAPKANAGLYVPMALAVTFPFNVTIGMPLYYWLVVNT
ncbi:MAG: sodium-dependent bicarbonate transport family permease [Bacteroidota bacterium]